MASDERIASSSSHVTIAAEPSPRPVQFLDKTPEAAAARAVYFKTIFGGVAALSVAIFAFFSTYWGSVWSSPRHTLPGWIVDFDGGVVGQSVAQALSAIEPTSSSVSWTVVPASQFPGRVPQIEDAVVSEKTWYALTINSGASANLTAAVATPDASYTPSNAITFIGSEARNENIYRIHSRIVSAQLEAITHDFGLRFLRNISSADNLAQLLSVAPQTVSRPIYFSSVNLRPFDVPVASAVTFVGLIYLLILAFFIVNVSASARLLSGLESRLSLRSLILLRLGTSFVASSIPSSRAPSNSPSPATSAPPASPIFWMLNFIGMLACGLALEAMLTLLTIRFVPFFLILWIIANVAAAVYPIQALPHIYRYGYGFPVYNISRAVRAIVFGTKNELGMNFGVLFAWIVLSCLTISLFQWFVRRRARSVAVAAEKP
ncbi:DUF3533 domain-containing protein [Mycena kentingensis (nom. inval.)]|nr:DUF3533 domain-containing protein [Mycena kentingensis (nom. inval.)]